TVAMAMLFTKVRFAIGAMALCVVVALAAPAGAQQPTLVNPNADAVKEQLLLQELNRIQGTISIPDTKARVLEQPIGREWRLFHQVYLHWIGGIAILGILSLLGTFYFCRGTFHFGGGRSGAKRLRLSSFGSCVHW